MKKLFVKITSILLSLLFVFLSTFSVCAVTSTESSINNGIIEALQNAEYIKDELGLDSFDFSEITISNPIYTYEYTNQGLLENNLMYPLKVDDVLVAWAIPLDDSSDTKYQITTALIYETNSVLQDNTNFALIYDYEYCYLYDGSEFYQLAEVTHNVENRSVLNVDNVYMDDFDIQLTNIDESVCLNYSFNQNTRVQTYYECPVGYVTQNPSPYLCWAATIASIVNYKKGTSYTAVDVAKKHYGNTNYNRTLTIGEEDNILISDYLLLYLHKDKIPGDSVIGKNIINDYPVYATFKNSNGGYHAVVIFGINTISGYISVMDPLSGACSATISGSGYRYVSVNSGVTFTLECATCRYWSV